MNFSTNQIGGKSDERLALVQTKIDRANKHFKELEVAINAFLATNPYEVVGKQDSHTRQITYYIARVEPIPFYLAAMTGDVIQNLRSALDHLAMQLYLVGPMGGDERSVYFPTDSSATQYNSSAPGKVRGMRQDAIDAINALEPYDGGKGADFSLLNRLNRIDKHRLLITVGFSLNSSNVGPIVLGLAKAQVAKAWPAKKFTFERLDIFLSPANRMFNLKVGDILETVPPESEVYKKSDFRFNVSLNEPGVIECEPLLDTLSRFGELVNRTLSNFRPLLS